MTSRSRSPISTAWTDNGLWPGSSCLAAHPRRALPPGSCPGQDTARTARPPSCQAASRRPRTWPLYRDPDPSEGPRIMGCRCRRGRPRSSRHRRRPPGNHRPVPAGSRGPLVRPASAWPPAMAPEPIQQPLLSEIPPRSRRSPPCSSVPTLARWAAVGTKRSTQISSPKGTLGTFSDYFHECFLWPDQPYEYGTLPATPVSGSRRSPTSASLQVLRPLPQHRRQVIHRHGHRAPSSVWLDQVRSGDRTPLKQLLRTKESSSTSSGAVFT